jgi:hypothetical protein
MFTLQFWKDASERAIATFAQALLAIVGMNLIVDWQNVNWWQVIVTALIAAALSIVKSIAVINVGEANNASVVTYDYLPTKPEPEEYDNEDEGDFLDESYSEGESFVEPVTLDNGEVEYGPANSQ